MISSTEDKGQRNLAYVRTALEKTSKITAIILIKTLDFLSMSKKLLKRTLSRKIRKSKLIGWFPDRKGKKNILKVEP